MLPYSQEHIHGYAEERAEVKISLVVYKIEKNSFYRIWYKLNSFFSLFFLYFFFLFFQQAHLVHAWESLSQEME